MLGQCGVDAEVMANPEILRIYVTAVRMSLEITRLENVMPHMRKDHGDIAMKWQTLHFRAGRLVLGVTVSCFLCFPCFAQVANEIRGFVSLEDDWHLSGGKITRPPLLEHESDALPEAPQPGKLAPAVFDTLRLQKSFDTAEEFESAPTMNQAGIPLNAALGVALQSTQKVLSRKSSEERFVGRSVGDEPWRNERFHWRGLLAQSLFFNAIESSFRIASDDQIRHLLAHKPFWHDYLASIRNFDMSRWDDGDEALVNYVGHPMQGAVSAFIEIQNDPIGRQQVIGLNHDYWVSRFKGFLWATVFSVHSEISPLGEAGIGNEGGWTYPVANCHRPCSIWNPQTMHHTNNTGWVDFVVTPTVGSLWMLAEDAIDHYVSDPLQGESRNALFPNIVRGALNPSRTMANAMRFKSPWYRDIQHGVSTDHRGIHMLASDDRIANTESVRRFALAAHYRTPPFYGQRKSPIPNGGFGFEVDYRITPWISASILIDKQHAQSIARQSAIPNVDSFSVPRSATVVGVGVRLTHDLPHNTFSLALRPGIITGRINVPAGSPAVRSNVRTGEAERTHTGATIMLSNDYKINRRLAIRSSFGALIVRYRTAIKDPEGIGTAPYISFLSHDNVTNHTIWMWQGGPVVHF